MDIRLALYGPSGSGKTYLKSYFIGKGFHDIKSYTTRPKRHDNDDEYIFVSEYDFKLLAFCVTPKLINVNKYHDHYYGIRKIDFTNSFEKAVLITDISSITELCTASILNKKRLILVYCEGPSEEELKERHRIRGTMDRFPIAMEEMKQQEDAKQRAHYVISNIEDAERLLEEISKYEK